MEAERSRDGEHGWKPRKWAMDDPLRMSGVEGKEGIWKF
jgi:hypothetical protein